MQWGRTVGKFVTSVTGSVCSFTHLFAKLPGQAAHVTTSPIHKLFKKCNGDELSANLWQVQLAQFAVLLIY